MPSMAITTLIKAASVLALAQQALGACYRPDGTDRNISPWIKDGEAPYQPCKKSGGGHSMCCNVNSFDECRDNGLCYTVGEKILWRESCTDPTWKDPACLKLCSGANQMTEDGKAMSGVDSVITVCSGDSQLCCGSGDFAQKCCDANKGFFIVNGAVVEAHPTPKTTAKLAPATTVTPAKETVTKTKQADPSPDTNSGGDNGGNSGGGTGGSNGGDSGGSSGGNNNDGDSNTGGNKNNGGSGTSPTESPDKEESTPGAGEEDATESESGVGAEESSPANSSEGSDNDATPTGKGKGDLASIKDGSGDTSSDNTDENGTGSATPSGSGSSGSNKNGNSSGGGEGEDGGGTATNGSTGKSSALIGGVLGGVLGGIILFAITAWFVIRKRRATKGERYVNTLGSASELPGTEGKIFYEVPGDYKFPVAQLPTRTQTRKGGELPVVESYHEMQARSPVESRPH